MAKKSKAEFEIRGDASRLASDLRRASETIRRSMTGSAKSTERAWRNTARGMRSQFDGVARGVSRTFDSLKRKLSSPITLAIGGVGGGAAVAHLSDLALSTRQLEIMASTVTGSNALGQRELAFATKLADGLGLALNDTRRSYMKLLASAGPANFKIAESRRIFEAVAKAGVSLGLSNEQLQGTFLAVEQMMSKGNVSAEELRGQLGERLPGAFQIAAKAMGVTTAQLDGMLKKGEVAAVDFLPRFARELENTFGGAAQENAALWNREIQRGLNTFTKFKTAFAEPVFQAFTPGIRDARIEIEAMLDSGKARDFGHKLGESITAAINMMRDIDLSAILIDGSLAGIANYAKWIANSIIDVFTWAGASVIASVWTMAEGALAEIQSLALKTARAMASLMDTVPFIDMEEVLAGIDQKVQEMESSTISFGDAFDKVMTKVEGGAQGVKDGVDGVITKIKDTIAPSQDLVKTWDHYVGKVREANGEVARLAAQQAAMVTALHVGLAVTGAQYASADTELPPFQPVAKTVKAKTVKDPKVPRIVEAQISEAERAAESFRQRVKTPFERLQDDLSEIRLLDADGVFAPGEATKIIDRLNEEFRAGLPKVESAWADIAQAARGGFRQLLSGSVEDLDQWLIQMAADIGAARLEKIIFDQFLGGGGGAGGSRGSVIDLSGVGQESAHTLSEGFARGLSERPEFFSGTNIETGASILLDSYEDAFVGVASAADSTASAMQDSFQRGGQGILGTIGNLVSRAGEWFSDLFSSIASGFKNVLGSGGGGGGGGFWGAVISGVGSVMSFDGGGYTGRGARAGGMDGRGGFPAILHPGEVVHDLSQGGGMGGTVINQTLNIQPGVSHDMIPQILAAARDGTLSAIRDQGRRGGRRARELGF